MTALDATVVNIALPTVQAEIGFGDDARAWVITSYTLPFASLLLLGGRMADRVGGRRTLLVGMVGFATASAIAGVATNLAMLVTGRALQGGCAAMMAPAGLALIATSFSDRRGRGKAFAVYGAVASSGAAVGLLAGGVLTEYAAWRWCLFLNVLVAVAATGAGRRYLPEQSPGTRSPLDVPSGLLATCGLAGVVLGCSRPAEAGWGSAQALVPLLLGAGLLCAFVFRQATARSPLLPLHVLAHRGRAAAYLSTAAAVVGSFGLFLTLTYHFQTALDYGPLRAGLAFLPMTVAVLISAYGLASRFLHRVEPGLLIVPGLLAAATGVWLLTGLRPETDYLSEILPGMVLVGAGMGCVFTPAFELTTRAVEPRLAGVAAAVTNTSTRSARPSGRPS